MEFITINGEEKTAQLITNLYYREQEIYGYQVNINNYTTLLNNLPNEWPADLEQYRNAGEDLAGVPIERLQEVSDLKFAARIAATLRTELVEQNKAKHIYQAMVAQLPAGTNLTEKLLEEKARIAAAAVTTA